MRILVTGAGGFIGGYLVEALLERGDTVEAWARGPLATAIAARLGARPVDVTDAAQVAVATASFAPHVIVHLAAQSLPSRSWESPAETYRVNLGGAVNLLEAVRALPAPPRLLLAGSSAEYAEPIDDEPITEQAVLEPNSPYAASKTAAATLGAMYRRRYGLDTLGFRPFFLIGPRKTGDVCSDFARRIVAIERGTERSMRVGDLRVVRDMIDVRDGVAGLLRLIDAGRPGETYNICGGRGVRIGEVLEAFRSLATVPITIREDPALVRPLEQKVKIGSAAKLLALGWAPRYRLSETFGEILTYWRSAGV